MNNTPMLTDEMVEKAALKLRPMFSDVMSRNIVREIIAAALQSETQAPPPPETQKPGVGIDAASTAMLEALHKIVNNWNDLHPKDRAQARDAIAKAEAALAAKEMNPSPETQKQVRPLDWKPHPEDGRISHEGLNGRRRYVSRALPPWDGAYFIMEKDGVYSLKTSLGSLDGEYSSEEDAKTAMQSIFSAWIHAALFDQPPQNHADAIAALREAEPYVEICHSLMTAKDTRANVWRVLKQVRAALAATATEGSDA